MISPARVVMVSFLLTVVITLPAILLARICAIGDLSDFVVVVRAYRNDVLRGRMTEEAVIFTCSTVMVAAWLRVAWTVVAVVSTARKGRFKVRIDRPLARIVLRVLMLTPVAMSTITSRLPATAASQSEAIGIGHGSESKSVSREVLLVSVLVAVGVSWRLGQLRATSLRGQEDRLDPRESAKASDRSEFESLVVRHGDDSSMARLELAARSLVAAGRQDFRWIVQHPSGVIHAECDTGGRQLQPWKCVSPGILALEPAVTLVDLRCLDGVSQARVPVLLPVGATSAGDVWVNLESVGSFYVEGGDTESDAVWNGLCQSLSLSPLHMSVNLISTIDTPLFGSRQLLTADPAKARRVGGLLHCPESPSVLLVATDGKRMLHLPDANPSSSVCGLARRSGSWHLLPMGQPVEPTSCGDADRRVLDRLLGNEMIPLPCDRLWPKKSGNRVELHPSVQRLLVEVSFIARTMGRPSVDHVEFGEVSFERSKSQELVLWLALHPQRQSRSSARSEMWSVPVKDSTFSNITSDVRRTLTALELPPDGEQWLSVTMNDDLPLHPRIVTDVELLEKCLDHARRFPDEGGAQALSFGLDFVRGSPFEGSRYLWRDGAGMATDIAMLVVRAAMLCAEMALERGDEEGLYRSTARGLEAVPGHEGLVALRMRQHARTGDVASLTAEWEAYCRSLLNDDWGDAQPSTKMVELWFSLSGTRMRS